MKKRILTALAAVAMAALSGCAILADHKDEIHAAIINAVESKGQQAAVEYIDQLVTDGKLGAESAEKIKAAIPHGIDKMKEAMNEKETENE